MREAHRDLLYAQAQRRQQLAELALLCSPFALAHARILLGNALLPLAGLSSCFVPALLGSSGSLSDTWLMSTAAWAGAGRCMHDCMLLKQQRWQKPQI